MKVYRYLSKYELEAIQRGDIDSIGESYDPDLFSRVNTHKYRKGVKYLHFFKNKKDLTNIVCCDWLPCGDYYRCEFDIPVYMLLMGCGRGYYNDGEFIESVCEFKIPAHWMSPKFLKSYEFDRTRVDINEDEWFK